MRRLIGVSNIGRRTAPVQRHAESVRLTAALTSRAAAEPEPESLGLARALQRALEKDGRTQPTHGEACQGGRRDTLAEAKAAAPLHNWNPGRQTREKQELA